MTQSKLRIQPSPSPEKLAQHFFLIGTVDVEAVESLQSLYVLPPNCSVVLDFSQVDRVNSMGLAQLLKLFELWQTRSNQIRIVHANRMIGILFKMTGLTRYLAEDLGGEKAPAPVAQPAPVAPPTEPKPASAGGTSQPGLAFGAEGLEVTPEPSEVEMVQQFNFSGMIDVNAVQILEKLYVVPQNAAVTLDFAQVQRVNSMGLAQLLKLFQLWQNRKVHIQVVNVNRMIGVLFKMTGLTRFLADAHSQNIPQAKLVTPPPAATPEPAPERRAADATPPAATPIFQDKLNLWINAQSSQQMNGWYFFNTYLQRHLGREIQMELSHGAISDRRKKIYHSDIVFTKPFEATQLMLKYGYTPLLRPIDQTDEVTLLVRTDDPRQKLAEFKGGKIVTASSDNFVYLLGRFMLEESDASMADMEYVFSGHDIKALQMLLKGSADILFMLSDTYNGLSGLTRKMLRQIDQSETAFAFHLFAVSPRAEDIGGELAEVLLNMNQDSQGRQVLADLGISGWIKPTSDECDMLTLLFKRYANVQT